MFLSVYLHIVIWTECVHVAYCCYGYSIWPIQLLLASIYLASNKNTQTFVFTKTLLFEFKFFACVIFFFSASIHKWAQLLNENADYAQVKLFLISHFIVNVYECEHILNSESISLSKACDWYINFKSRFYWISFQFILKTICLQTNFNFPFVSCLLPDLKFTNSFFWLILNGAQPCLQNLMNITHRRWHLQLKIGAEQ